MRLNYFLVPATVVLLGFAAAFDVNYFNYGRPIPYSAIGAISFYDFKGLKKPGGNLDGMNEFAFIKTNRDIRFITDTSLELESWFYPSRSYVFDQQLHSPALLQHELYHFRITEYFTRLFRKEVSGNSFDHETISGPLAEKYREQEAIMQWNYDDESYHSYVLKEQVKWQNNVDSLLQSLSTYANPYVHFHRTGK